jgi:hypothetical protein
MHLIGVDLGRQNDFAAPVIFEDELVQKPVTSMPIDVPARYLDVPSLLVRRYNLVDMAQWRGVSYPQTAKMIKNMVDSPLLSRDYILVVDSTGVGQAVMDMLHDDYDLNPVGVTFTAGKSVTESKYGYNVPKRDLVVGLQVLFQMERIRISEDLELAAQFKEQLRHFSSVVDRSTGHESYGADDENIHDDLPMAAAIVMWYAEHVLAHELELPSSAKGGEKAYNPATFGLS